MQLFKSLLFTTYMMASACLFGTVMALCFWLPCGTQFAIARTWARILLWVLEHLCGLNYVVEGGERIPPGNHIVMSNHTSAWETIAQFLIFPPQVWVLKRELLWIPFIGWGLKLLRPIAIKVQESVLIAVQRRSLQCLKWQLTRRETTQFRILNPQVRFNELSGGEEAQNRDVSFCKPVILIVVEGPGFTAHQASADSNGSSCEGAGLQK